MSLNYLILVLGAAALLISACAPFTPYDPNRSRSQPDAPAVTPDDSEVVTSTEQDELRDARRQAELEAEARDSESTTDNTTSGGGDGGTTSTGGSDYRRAVPIPGKEGFVFNPFTNNPVDVRGIPSGSLVYDPQDPNKDRNRFRVP